MSSVFLYQGETEFRIKLGKQRAALKALREWNPDIPKRNTSLYNAMNDFTQWYVEIDEETGDIDGIKAAEEACDNGDEGGLFKTLGSYVEAGSYIHASNSENVIWRWFFDGEQCHEQEARIVYDDIPLKVKQSGRRKKELPEWDVWVHQSITAVYRISAASGREAEKKMMNGDYYDADKRSEKGCEIDFADASPVEHSSLSSERSEPNDL